MYSQEKVNAMARSLKPKLLRVISWGIGFPIGYIIGKYLGFGIILIWIIPIIIGSLISNWYIKRNKISNLLIKCISWSNILTWFFPPIGIFTGILAINFRNHSAKHKKQFMTLGVIGITFALINSVVGCYLSGNESSQSKPAYTNTAAEEKFKYTQEDLEYTAKKHGLTIEQVKAYLKKEDIL